MQFRLNFIAVITCLSSLGSGLVFAQVSPPPPLVEGFEETPLQTNRDSIDVETESNLEVMSNSEFIVEQDSDSQEIIISDNINQINQINQINDVNSQSRLAPGEWIYINSPEAISGDTFFQNGMYYRLNYIDAPHVEKNCQIKNDFINYKCGASSRDYLQSIIEDQTLSCLYVQDISNGIVVDCFVSNENVSLVMVKTGHAKVVRSLFTDIFKEEEDESRFFNRGIWKYN